MSEYVSIESLSSQAEAYLARGLWQAAEQKLRVLLLQSHLPDYEYNEYARKIARTYKQLDLNLEVSSVLIYLQELDEARAFAGDSQETLARIAESSDRWQEAAEHYQKADMPIHAAVQLHKGGAFHQAADLWQRICNIPAIKNSDYEHALAEFNRGMAYASALSEEEDPNATLGGQLAEKGRAALVSSQQILEEVAAMFQVHGQRDRAFDCYQVLLELGRRSGQFENLAEGYHGCIRVLKEDNLKFYALQFYEDFVEQALARREFHAAATLLQEASRYCSQVGLPYADHYLAQSGDAWAKCAQRHVEDGVSLGLVENALLASVSCYSAVSDFRAVKAIFESLANLDLGDTAKSRYREVAKRYDGYSASTNHVRFPEYLRKKQVYTDIWFVDLLSWEIGSNLRSLAMSIVGDLRFHDSIRRRALSILLLIGAATREQTLQAGETQKRLIRLVGELQSYGALFPLEQMYEQGDPDIRKACVEALRFLYFKRSFVMLEQALEESDLVRESAIEVLKGRIFPHALNPLRSIFDTHQSAEIQAAALEAVGKIQTVEAGEYLVEIIRHERGDVRSQAQRALGMLDNPDIVPIVERHLEVERDEGARNALQSIISTYR